MKTLHVSFPTRECVIEMLAQAEEGTVAGTSVR